MIKSMRKLMILFLLITGLVSACGPSANSAQSPTITPTLEPSPMVTASPTATVMPTPTSTPLPLNGQQTQYFIDLTINYYNRFIDGTSRAIYINKTETPIDKMVFIIYPAIFQAIYIKSISFGDGSQITNYDWESHRVVIPLDTPLMPGEQLEIRFSFELYMPDRDGMGGIFSQTGKELNLSYFFPMIPPFDADQGWIVHDPQIVNSTFVGEYLVCEPSDFDLTIQFTDRRENFNIAAPAIPTEDDGVIHYQVNLARTLTISISDQFTLNEREVDGTKIIAYTLNEHGYLGDVVADIAVEAFSLYSEIFGHYDRDILSIVEFNANIGMEFDGLVFLSPPFYNLYPGTPRSNLYIYTAHEIAHQWFYSLVGNDPAIEPWLDEAFATYAQKLFFDKYYPEDSDWMWENYVTSFDPQGNIDSTIYFGGDDHDYRKTVYLHGALFLQDLRTTIGDDTFFDFVKDYVQTHRYQIVTTEEFWSSLQKHTDVDLTALRNEYFSTPTE
jgi:hypothetical protein